MATLPELVAWRDRLQECVYSGARSVRDSNGEELQYRSQRELTAALQSLNSEIHAMQSELGCSRIVYPRTSKGI